MLVVLLAVSFISFTIIQLPPGDFLTARMAQLKMQGGDVSIEQMAMLKHQYGLDKPFLSRYVHWVGGMVQGDLGRSFLYERPVTELIGERLVLTMAISICSILLTYLIAIPIGLYASVRQYSIGDYCFTLVGFIGMSIPQFFLALILLFVVYRVTGTSMAGLFSAEYAVQPWSWGKVIDLLKHLWVPSLIVGIAGTAGTIRVLRACLLDELSKPYVITARARGVSEWRLILKYPLRIALNPMISTIGWLLPSIVSGTAIVAIVLNLPTTGPMLLEALLMQDMYLAGSFIMVLCVLTVIGTFISDVLLAWSDPRVRYG